MSKKRSFGDPYNIKLNTSETEDKLNLELKEVGLDLSTSKKDFSSNK